MFHLACVTIRSHTVSFYVEGNDLGNVLFFLGARAQTVRRVSRMQPVVRNSIPPRFVVSRPISVKTPPYGVFFAPCAKLKELHPGDGFIGIPSTLICCVLGSISSRTLSHLTLELSSRSQATEATRDVLSGGLVRLLGRQETGGRLAVALRAGRLLHTTACTWKCTVAYHVLEIEVCCS